MKSILIFGAKATKKDPKAAYFNGGPPKNIRNGEEERVTGRAIALGAAFALMSISVAPSAIAAQFDGDWSLVAHTADGHCGITHWNLAIRGGRVYYPEGYALGGYPVGIAGRVWSSGVIRVNVAAGPRYASGAGRLWQLQGSGRWAGRGPSGTCAGVWTATRVNTYGAGAAGRYPRRLY